MVVQRNAWDDTGQLIHILRVEIVPDVVVARTIIVGQISGERRKNPSRREGQEPSVLTATGNSVEQIIEAYDMIRPLVRKEVL